MIKILDYTISPNRRGYNVLINGRYVYTGGTGRPRDFASFNEAEAYAQSIKKQVYTNPFYYDILPTATAM